MEANLHGEPSPGEAATPAGHAPSGFCASTPGHHALAAGGSILQLTGGPTSSEGWTESGPQAEPSQGHTVGGCGAHGNKTVWRQVCVHAPGLSSARDPSHVADFHKVPPTLSHPVVTTGASAATRSTAPHLHPLPLGSLKRSSVCYFFVQTEPAGLVHVYLNQRQL